MDRLTRWLFRFAIVTALASQVGLPCRAEGPRPDAAAGEKGTTVEKKTDPGKSTGPVPETAPGEYGAALVRKLHGKWKGGPCMGTLLFRPDGTFERENYSPGGNRLSGNWRIRWDALPPTLILECTDSDSDHFSGKPYAPKLLELTGEHLGLLHLDAKTVWPQGELNQSVGEGISRYARVKPTK